MMIQSSNPLSLLLGSESGGAVQSGLLADGGDTSAFTASLMQQLALLQGNLANNTNVDTGVLAALQARAGALDGHVAGQEMQDFAALFGKTLPTAKKLGQDINLDDTLSALADVLQHLQALETAPADPMLGQAANDGSISAAVDQILSIDTAAVAAAVAAAMQQQATPPQSTQQPVAGDLAVQASNAAAVVGDDVLLSIKKAVQQGNANTNSQVFAATQGGGDTQSSALDDATTSALLSQDNTSQNAGKDNQASSDNTDNGLLDLASQSKSTESDKVPSRMAADIAQLNRVASADKTVEVPAMRQTISHPGWNQELGEKLIWMHKQDIPSAELRLNPQHLGPISIKVDVNQDQANVTFTTHHAAVKEAIEAALPKLREMLSGQQLNLADVNVSQQQSEQRQPRDFFQAAGGQGNGGNPGQNDDSGAPVSQAAADIVEEIEAGRAIAGNGLLSLFA